MLPFIAMAALITGAVMLSLAISDIRNDRKLRGKRWRPWHSFDVILYAIGFVCVILTALYAFLGGVVCI